MKWFPGSDEVIPAGRQRCGPATSGMQQPHRERAMQMSVPLVQNVLVGRPEATRGGSEIKLKQLIDEMVPGM